MKAEIKSNVEKTHSQFKETFQIDSQTPLYSIDPTIGSEDEEQTRKETNEQKTRKSATKDNRLKQSEYSVVNTEIPFSVAESSIKPQNWNQSLFEGKSLFKDEANSGEIKVDRNYFLAALLLEKSLALDKLPCKRGKLRWFQSSHSFIINCELHPHCKDNEQFVEQCITKIQLKELPNGKYFNLKNVDWLNRQLLLPQCCLIIDERGKLLLASGDPKQLSRFSDLLRPLRFYSIILDSLRNTISYKALFQLFAAQPLFVSTLKLERIEFEDKSCTTSRIKEEWTPYYEKKLRNPLKCLLLTSKTWEPQILVAEINFLLRSHCFITLQLPLELYFEEKEPPLKLGSLQMQINHYKRLGMLYCHVVGLKSEFKTHIQPLIIRLTGISRWRGLRFFSNLNPSPKQLLQEEDLKYCVNFPERDSYSTSYIAPFSQFFDVERCLRKWVQNMND